MNNEETVVIFLDDERHINDVTWVQYPENKKVFAYKTFEHFKWVVDDLMPKLSFSQILWSFDHDLQDFDEDGNEKTGYDCVKYLCDKLVDLNYDVNRLQVVAHTKNPVGKANIEEYVNNFKKHIGTSYYLIRNVDEEGIMTFVAEQEFSHKTKVMEFTRELSKAQVFEYDRVCNISHTGMVALRKDMMERINKTTDISFNDYLDVILVDKFSNDLDKILAQED